VRMLTNQPSVSYCSISRMYHTAHLGDASMAGCQRGSWGSLWKAGVKTASPLHRLDARKRPLGRFHDEWLGGGAKFL
jgi:hypothetical protein